MTWKFRYRPVAELPKLMWLATIQLESKAVTIFHGLAVECRDQWMVEGIWDGEFWRGNFHRSEHFFGSGIRAEGDRLYCVASSALVDRLFYCRREQALLVANSLIALLAFTNSRLDRSHERRERLDPAGPGALQERISGRQCRDRHVLSGLSREHRDRRRGHLVRATQQGPRDLVLRAVLRTAERRPGSPETVLHQPGEKNAAGSVHDPLVRLRLDGRGVPGKGDRSRDVLHEQTLELHRAGVARSTQGFR